MAFKRKWPVEVETALVAEVLAGRTVDAVHARALAGEVIGVRAEHVPPIGTLRYWATTARRDLATERAAAQGAGAVAERIAGRIAVALERHAERAERDVEKLGRVARATAELVKLRREIDRANPAGNADGSGENDRPRNPDGNDLGDTTASGFVEQLAAENG